MPETPQDLRPKPLPAEESFGSPLWDGLVAELGDPRHHPACSDQCVDGGVHYLAGTVEATP